MTLKYAVEDAIYAAAPDVMEVIAVGAEKPSVGGGFIPLAQLTLDDEPDAAKWHAVGGMDAVAERTIQVQRVNGRSLLFTRLNENLYAYSDTCPHCENVLVGSRLDGTALACPHCQQSYDMIRAGRGLDKPDLQLEPFPLLVEKGEVKVALPV